jgi:hypothetical protein
MASTFKYRMIKGSWGIAIDLTADCVLFHHFSGDALEIDDDLWLAVEVKGLSRADHEFLAYGLKQVASEIKTHASFFEPTVICVTDVWYNPCDYQPEGLAHAIIGWAAQELKFDVPHIDVHFSQKDNRYIFQFD